MRIAALVDEREGSLEFVSKDTGITKGETGVEKHTPGAAIIK